MKKQILFMMFLSLAFVFAGMKSYGQAGAAKPYQTVPDNAPVCITPKPLEDCTTSELNPVQGEVYTYTVTTTAETDDVRWFVVNNYDVETDGDSLVSSLGGVLPSDNGNIDPADGDGDYILELGDTHNTYNEDPQNGDDTGTDKSIEIAWKYFDGMQPNEVLLVAYVEGNDGCTNNIAVYRIVPMPAFTIDVAVLNDNGDSIAGPLDPITGECVSPIESADYTSIDNATPNGELVVDYGENWVFFIVNGANYIDSWMPEFQISYADGEEPADVEASWAYASDASNSDASVWNDLSGTVGGTWSSANPVIAGASAASPGSVGDGEVPTAGGECIVVRVRLDWGEEIEHDQETGTLTFAVDGIAYDGDDSGDGGTFFDDTAFADLHHEDCTADDFDNDVVDYEITPRPQVEEVDPDQEDKTGEGIN